MRHTFFRTFGVTDPFNAKALFKNFHIQADFVSYHFDSYFILLVYLIKFIRLNLFAAPLPRFLLE